MNATCSVSSKWLATVLFRSEAAEAYATFQQKKDGCIKVVLDPTR